MLQVEHLSVEIAGRTVLHDVDLRLAPGEVHVLFGPNGSGNTSLLMAIMGVPRYRVTCGQIIHDGEDITALPADERARRGIGLVYQRPPTVHGIRLRQLAEICAVGDRERVAEVAGRLRCTDLLDRDVHDGFSGGEIKKAELLQVMLQRPAVVLVDEPDAGVDLDNITLVGEGLAGLLRTPLPDGSAPAGLVITHTGHVLSHVRADVGHVLVGGTLVGEAGADRLLEEIRRHGYGKRPLCRSQTPAH